VGISGFGLKLAQSCIVEQNFETGSGGASSCKFWTSTINRNFYFIIGILRSRAIDWYINGCDRRRSGGGGVGGVFLVWDPSSKILLRHFPEIVILYLESSVQAQLIGTLFE